MFSFAGYASANCYKYSNSCRIPRLESCPDLSDEKVSKINFIVTFIKEFINWLSKVM